MQGIKQTFQNESFGLITQTPVNTERPLGNNHAMPFLTSLHFPTAMNTLNQVST